MHLKITMNIVIIPNIFKNKRHIKLKKKEENLVNTTSFKKNGEGYKCVSTINHGGLHHFHKIKNKKTTKERKQTKEPLSFLFFLSFFLFFYPSLSPFLSFSFFFSSSLSSSRQLLSLLFLFTQRKSPALFLSGSPFFSPPS